MTDPTERPQATAILNTLAGIMASNIKRDFPHKIIVTTRTKGGDICLNRSKKVYVHPRLLEAGMLPTKIIERIFLLTDERTLYIIRLREASITDYTARFNEAVRYLEHNMSPADYQRLVESTVGLA